MNPERFHVARLVLPFLAIAVCCGHGMADAEEKVITFVVPGGGRAMAAKTDAKGTIHVVFETTNGPHYASSTDNGKSLGKTIALVDRASRKFGLEFIIWDMAVGPDGAVHIVMGTNAWKLKLPKDQWGYMYTRKLPGNQTFEPVRNLNHQPSEGYSLAVGDNGAVAAVWMEDKLYVNLSNDGGKSFGPTTELDPALNPCNCCTTSSVYAADGRLAILYREETNDERDMYLALWKPQQKALKTRVSTTDWKIDSCPMTYYTVARDEDGFVAAWPTRGEVYFARLSADGTPRAPQEIKTPGRSGMRCGVLALPMEKGRTLVAWKKDNQLDWQLYDELGKPSGLPSSVSSHGGSAVVTLNKSGDIVVFQ